MSGSRGYYNVKLTLCIGSPKDLLYSTTTPEENLEATLLLTKSLHSLEVADIAIPSIEDQEPAYIRKLFLEGQITECAVKEVEKRSSMPWDPFALIWTNEARPFPKEPKNSDHELRGTVENFKFHLHTLWDEENQGLRNAEVGGTSRSKANSSDGERVFGANTVGNYTSQDDRRHTTEPILASPDELQGPPGDKAMGNATDQPILCGRSTPNSGHGRQEISLDSSGCSVNLTEAFLGDMMKQCGEAFILSPGSSLPSHGGTSSPSRSSGSTETPSSLSTSPNLSRKSLASGRRRSDEEDEEGNKRSNQGFKRPRVGPGDRPFPGSEQGRRLACHLHISDPQRFCRNGLTSKKYDTCSGPGWLDMHHLK